MTQLRILCAAMLAICGAFAATFDYPRLGPPWPAKKQPSWINKGIVFVGTWEPLPWLYRKNWQDWGNAKSGRAAEAIYREERTEATVIGLKQLGVNMVLTSFHKGFGIRNEKVTMDEAREYAKLLHKHGLKMGVYVSALLIYEDLYGEFPEAKDWNRVLYDGTPDTYGGDNYRYRAFLNHPGYMNYMKKVCELAVQSGADLIHFDVITQTPENHHPLAQKMFREWLRKRYPTAESWFFRTGLHYWDYVKIPHNDLARFSTFDQPIMQEYLVFASQLVDEYGAEMSTFIRKLNPEVAVEFNPAGINGSNRVLMNNIDHFSLLPWLDAYWSEEAEHASYTADGRLITKIRSYKVGEQDNAVAFTYTGPRPPLGDREVNAAGEDPRLSMAESMAFNRQCLGDVGSPLVYKSFPSGGRRYIQFFWKNFDLFEKGDSAAEVAVLRDFASLAYNNYDTHRETILAEQTLIQSQIPFDLIGDRNLTDLRRYKVVILADQESLSDEQVRLLHEYVRSGGGIVFTANTARYDEWRRERGASGLADLLQRPASGSGRAAYIRQLTPGIPIPRGRVVTNQYRAPAKNAKEFVDAIRQCAAGKLKWEIIAPPFVVPNVYHQAGRKRHLVHLVNFNALSQPVVRGVEIALRTAAPVTKVTVYSPDEAAPSALTPTRTPDGFKIALPKLGIYSIISIQAP